MTFGMFDVWFGAIRDIKNFIKVKNRPQLLPNVLLELEVGQTPCFKFVKKIENADKVLTTFLILGKSPWGQNSFLTWHKDYVKVFS